MITLYIYIYISIYLYIYIYISDYQLLKKTIVVLDSCKETKKGQRPVYDHIFGNLS